MGVECGGDGLAVCRGAFDSGGGLDLVERLWEFLVFGTF